MNKLIFVLLLMLSTFTWAAEPNPAEYTIDVHVTCSKMVLEGNLGFNQRLDVIIDGKKYELRTPSVNALLALGNYKAKLVRDEHRSPYDSFQVYEFLFSDKKTRKYEVVGQWE